jgi:hypothetical protein
MPRSRSGGASASGSYETIVGTSSARIRSARAAQSGSMSARWQACSCADHVSGRGRRLRSAGGTSATTARSVAGPRASCAITAAGVRIDREGTRARAGEPAAAPVRTLSAEHSRSKRASRRSPGREGWPPPEGSSWPGTSTSARLRGSCRGPRATVMAATPVAPEHRDAGVGGRVGVDLGDELEVSLGILAGEVHRHPLLDDAAVGPLEDGAHRAREQLPDRVPEEPLARHAPPASRHRCARRPRRPGPPIPAASRATCRTDGRRS